MKHLIGMAAIAAVTASFAGAAVADGFQLQPGKYEITGKMKMPMMPQGMPVNNTQCVTQEQTDMKAEDIAEQMAPGADCTIQNLDMSDKKMDFAFTCKGGEMGTVSGQYDISFGANSYSMDGKFTASDADMTMEMQADAKRIGDC
ncbi:MAG: DUF3617 family protein [Pseudomonadota bacterium]